MVGWSSRYPSQPSAYLSVRLARIPVCQFGYARFHRDNKEYQLPQTLNVSGTLVAYLTCGNQVSTYFNAQISPGKSVGGGDVVTGSPDYTGVVTEQDCKGVKSYYDAQNPQLYHVNRIRSVGLTGLSVTFVQVDNGNPSTGSAATQVSPTQTPPVKLANTYTQSQAQAAVQQKVNAIQQTTEAATRFNNSVQDLGNSIINEINANRDRKLPGDGGAK